NRSFLFAPGNVARRVEKALTLEADAVILDLEDSVAPSDKPATRKRVAEALRQPRRVRGYVRVNAPSTEFCYRDLVETIHERVDGMENPIDSPWFHFKEAEAFRRALERSRRGGFQGRLCVHPDQIGPVNSAYLPSAEELARAERIVAAFRQAEAKGEAAIQVD